MYVALWNLQIYAAGADVRLNRFVARFFVVVSLGGSALTYNCLGVTAGTGPKLPCTFVAPTPPLQLTLSSAAAAKHHWCSASLISLHCSLPAPTPQRRLVKRLRQCIPNGRRCYKRLPSGFGFGLLKEIIFSNVAMVSLPSLTIAVTCSL